MNKFSFKKTIDFEPNVSICDYISQISGLSKMKVKEAMQKGALHIKSGKGKFRRVRRAKTKLIKGSRIEFNYDEKLLYLAPKEATLIQDYVAFSAWFKPSGMLTQGTKYGDHCSLLRFVELHFKPEREVFLVHRLDREASGMVILAHDKKAAAKLCNIFAGSSLMKEYKIEVMGLIEGEGIIDKPLDEKKALSRYRVTGHDDAKGTTTLSVTIETGRYHQIRRHFDMIGHPVIGDPLYGKGNKNRQGMKLSATCLEFKSPFNGKDIELRVPEGLMEW